MVQEDDSETEVFENGPQEEDSEKTNDESSESDGEA